VKRQTFEFVETLHPELKNDDQQSRECRERVESRLTGGRVPKTVALNPEFVGQDFAVTLLFRGRDPDMGNRFAYFPDMV
jgi:hypothetical protein